MLALLTTMPDRVKRHRVLHFTVDRTRQSSLENLTEVYVVYTRDKTTNALRFCLLYPRIAEKILTSLTP